MVYKNKNGQPRERAMVAAYALVNEFGATQGDVAKALGCSQATVANWVKEVGYQKQINGLQRELGDAKDYIDELHQEIHGYLDYRPEDDSEDDGDWSESDDDWDDQR